MDGLKKKMNILMILFGTLLIALPIALFSFKSGGISESENRELSAFPSVTNDDGTLNRSLKADFMSWFEDHIGLRDELLSLRGRMEYYVFNRSSNESVQFGKDGWLFYDGENEMEIVSGEYPIDDEYIEKLCAQQQTIYDALKEKGIEYVLILTPAKDSVYPEYVASGEYEVSETPIDTLCDAIEERTDVRVVRLKDALLEAKESSDEFLYYPNDTHWNNTGAYVAYKEILNSLNSWGLLSAEPALVTYTEEPYEGDLQRMLGFSDESLNVPSKMISIENQKSRLMLKKEHDDATGNVFVDIEEPGNDVDWIYAFNKAFGAQYYNVRVNGENADSARVLMFCESFMYEEVTDLLAENCSFIASIYDVREKDDYINVADPDILCYSIGERYLNEMYDRLSDFEKACILGLE